MIISIIIPVYNRERQICQCLDSVLSQSYTNIEVIVVDDGSTDNTPSICDDYANHDQRVVVIHKENGGVSSARNVGIDVCKGSWVCFVDSDDIVSSKYVENLLLEKGDADFVWTEYSCKGDELLINNKVEIKGKDCANYILNNKLLNKGTPYCKLYNVNLLNRKSVRFPQGIHNGEDVIFVTNYLKYVRSIIFSPIREDYTIIRSENSLGGRYYDFNTELLTFEKIYRAMVDWLSLYYPSDIIPKLIWKARLYGFFNHLQLADIINNQPEKVIIQNYHKIPLQYFREYYAFASSSSVWGRLAIFLFRHKCYNYYIKYMRWRISRR